MWSLYVNSTNINFRLRALIQLLFYLLKSRCATREKRAQKAKTPISIKAVNQRAGLLVSKKVSLNGNECHKAIEWTYQYRKGSI